MRFLSIGNYGVPLFDRIVSDISTAEDGAQASKRGTQALVSIASGTNFRHHRLVQVFALKGLAMPTLQEIQAF
jgi:hypothetical protein